MARQSRRWLSAWIRYAVCFLALGWLWYDTDWAQFKQVLACADWRLAGLALLAFGPAPVLISFRLQWLLAVQGIHISAWEAIKVTFAGNFVIFALPVGTGGGDSLKAFYVTQHTPHKHEAVTTVFFDRAIGVTGLLLMSGVVVLADWDNPAFATWGRIIGGMILALMATGGLYFSRRVRRILRVDAVLSRLPFGAHLQRIDRAVFLFRSHPRTVIACVALTALLQFICLVSYFLGGWALGLIGDGPMQAFPVYLAYGPIGLLAGGLPIGVMEVTFSELLADTAALGPAEAAISLSFLGRLIQLTWALPGALAVLRSRPPASYEADLAESAEPLSAPASETS